MNSKNLKKALIYFTENWKMIVHLLLKTRRFGVNNQAWYHENSIFGASPARGFSQILKNYKMMKIRAFTGFIPLNEAIEMFPYHAKKHGYRSIENNK